MEKVSVKSKLPSFSEEDAIKNRDRCIDLLVEHVVEVCARKLRKKLPDDLRSVVHPSWSPLIVEWKHDTEDRVTLDVSLASDLASRTIDLQDAKMIFREVYLEASAKVPSLFGSAYRDLVKKHVSRIDTRDMREDDFLQFMKKRKIG